MIMNPIFGSGKKVSMTMLLPVLAAILSLMLITPSSYASVGSSDTTSTTDTSPTTVAATNSSVLPPPQPEGIVNVGVTPNQLAAGGPLPGNHSVALEEA